jgi:hypothetical protein
MRFVAVPLAFLAIAPAHAGGPHWGWPHAAPMDMVFHRDYTPRGGNGLQPNAVIYGPSGPVAIPTVDRRAHRTMGVGTRRFARPVWHGARLDWCSAGAQGCGPVAAQAFCRARGFRRVVEAVQERRVGLYAHTVQIGSGLSCTGSGCAGFARITCTHG